MLLTISRHPRANPKPATSAKPSTKGTTAREGGRGRGGRRGRNAGRAKPKTADELDAEMSDYFGATGTNGTTGTDGAFVNGTNQPIANGEADLGMDEISVRILAVHVFYVMHANCCSKSPRIKWYMGIRPHLSRLFSALRASHGFTGGRFLDGGISIYGLVGSVSERGCCMAGQAL